MQKLIHVTWILIILLMTCGNTAHAQYHSDDKIPPRAQLDAMVSDTIQAYNLGLQKKDFTAFHSWVSTKAQKLFTPPQMLEASKPLTDRKVNLAVLKGRAPSYPKEPELVQESGMGVLRVTAVYTIKQTIVVKLRYITEKKLWRLLTIDVSLQ